MHEITVHQLFPYGFRAFFWRWDENEKSSNTGTFDQNYFHSVLHPPQGLQKKQKILRTFNLYDWCCPGIQPHLKICKYYSVFHSFSNLIQVEMGFLILFFLFWDAWQSLPLINSGLDLGNMKGIRIKSPTVPLRSNHLYQGPKGKMLLGFLGKSCWCAWLPAFRTNSTSLWSYSEKVSPESLSY